MRTVTSPANWVRRTPVGFLGGSIEQGSAVDWQAIVATELASYDVELLNPRREHWDSTWRQDPTPGTSFYGQVDWELEGQEYADFCIYVFDANTMSPITLLELGLFVRTKQVFVCCPKAFWRYGNVKMTFDRYALPGSSFTEDLDLMLQSLKERLDRVS